MTVYVVLECFGHDSGDVRVAGVYESLSEAEDNATNRFIGDNTGAMTSCWVEACELTIDGKALAEAMVPK